ncbi:MAG: N-acetylglucosamine kinase [Rhizobiaceae bacterium]|nr:N-acetylglucosamine kinase [Rhizobiaceae bacterium]
MNGTALFLGIDGGASRCRARLRDMSGKLLGEGHSGPANIAVDVEQARESVMEAAAGALLTAGLAPNDTILCHAGVGLAGAATKDRQQQLLEGWKPFATIRLASDAYIAWLGAHGGEDGAVVVLGTGSVCYGRIGAREHFLGGWGSELSDEGGAASIGRECLRRSIWAWDGRIGMTPLSENVLAMFGGTPVSLIAAVRKATLADHAAYAPLVFQFAEQGDDVAVAILRDAVVHVSRMIGCLVSNGFGRIALVGGIASPMISWLPDDVRAHLCAPRNDANEGAIMMARQAIG